MFLDGTSTQSGLRQAWLNAARLQIRVVSALVRRETRAHFGESRLGYLWAIIEPTLHLAGYVVLFVYILGRRVPVGGSIVLFMLTGMLPYFLYNKLASYLTSAIPSNKTLLNLPPVKPLDVLLSRAILEASTYLLVGIIMLTTLFLVTGDEQTIPRNPLGLAVATAVIVLFGFGLGAINSTVQAYFSHWAAIFGLVFGPLYLLSGVWFLPAEVPPPLRDYLLYNPILHLVLWFRTGFYPPEVTAYLDRGYALCWAIGVLIAGLLLQRVMRRKILEPS